MNGPENVYMPPHTGDVNSPEEFGLNVADPADRERWERITQEVPVTVSDIIVHEDRIVRIQNTEENA